MSAEELPPDVATVAKLGGRRPRTLLPSEPPHDAATAGELSAWLTVVLGLGRDPIVAATRFGRSDDSRCVVTTKSQQRIVFDRQAELFDSKVLVRRFVQITSATREQGIP